MHQNVAVILRQLCYGKISFIVLLPELGQLAVRPKTPGVAQQSKRGLQRPRSRGSSSDSDSDLVPSSRSGPVQMRRLESFDAALASKLDTLQRYEPRADPIKKISRVKFQSTGFECPNWLKIRTANQNGQTSSK